ncbi:MAG TPA: type ISP restriction/modification enzyme [Pseudolabrys sp.]|jgi:predicted helicase|nr:type ISP restriction/modification enzyme [Pseudolabrys sp.]
MADKNLFDRYLLALRKTPVDEKTEHTDRSALQTLLQALADDSSTGIAVQHEPKRVADKGAPDFKITKSGLILGYVENKAIGEPLDKVLKSDQIKRYKSLSQNIVLTDYLHFIWINKDGIQRETLCHATDLQNTKFKLKEDRTAAVAKLLQGFFSTAPEGIGSAQKLALALATRSKLLHDYLGEELVRQEREHKEGRLYGLFQIFRDQVFHELTLNEFADAFAQMLAYGLFLARLNSDSNLITLHNAREYVPGSFRLIRELVDFLTELEKAEYRDVRWVVEEVLSIVNDLKLTEIHEDLSFRHRKAISRKVRAGDEEEHRLFERDPFIYFYEDYLKAYDAATRKARGVYYTPPPIVNFIVRAVDDILKESFGIPDGLANHQRVTVLDFACGTGTFLLEAFQRIFDNIGGPDDSRADLIVRDHLLKNVFGFEYLIAPYTIAHLKLSQYLKDQNHALKNEERLQVFLTNTLEPIHPEPNFLLPAITQEAEAAQTVKDRPILVITGNPPYSAHSKNKGEWITAAIEPYKMVDGKHFGEKKHWLHDDYVKFIRFAQLKMDAVEEGIVGIITNHSWLDNPTFRGMRQSLTRSFEQIYVLDLHGNAKKKERAPDGSLDENVFDIEQGVAISLFVKRPGLEQGVWRGDYWGSRLAKYQTVASNSFGSFKWSRLEVASPQYLFKSLGSNGGAQAYSVYWAIPDVFLNNTPGIITARDRFSIGFRPAELDQRVSRLIDSRDTDKELREKYDLKDTRGWSLTKAREALREGPDWKTSIRPILQAPFDRRYVAYDIRLIDWGRWNFTSRLSNNKLGLCLPRKIDIQRPWDHVFVADELISHHALSMKEVNYIFPLNIDSRENISPKFRAFIDERYEPHYTPEEIFGYIYAVLHAPTYRNRYAEFLRIDFPRVPFPELANDFENLSVLGWALVQAHLLREVPRRRLAVYQGKGEHMVEAVRYSTEDQAASINKTQFFKPIPEAVWNFDIGGYQVLDKYLKSRKGRKLSLDEINHVGAIADSLAFTIEQMAKIDEAYKAAFVERG